MSTVFWIPIWDPSAQAAYYNLRKTSNIDGTIIGYPGIEVVFDGFGVVVDCIDRFETSQRPTLHVALPTIYRMLAKIDDVAHGSKVWRCEGQALAHPSIYSCEFCRVLREKMLSNS